jgi:hypothetical protein
MTKIKALVAIFVLLLFAAPAAQRDDWVEVSSPLRGFRIKMPGQPKESALEATEGRQTFYTYSDAEGARTAVVMVLSYVALKSSPDNAEAFLKKGVEDFAKSLDGKVVSLTRREYRVPNYSRRNGKLSVTIQTYPGLEARVKAAGSMTLLISYVDVVNRRLFMMKYAAQNERYSEAEAKRFFDSFSLLY